MKYILGPFFKYLVIIIVFLLQFIIAVIYTIVWGVPTLLFYIIYMILMTIWNFKIMLYKFKQPYIKSYEDSISCNLLWSEKSKTYYSYFHLIWNLSIRKPIMVQIINKINKQLN